MLFGVGGLKEHEVGHEEHKLWEMGKGRQALFSRRW